MPTDTLLVYCTCPDSESARHIANQLVDERLAACVTLSAAVTSVYRWQDARETTQELQLMIKSSRQRYSALEQRIVALHPYELPEIIAVTVEHGLPGYLNWVNQCTEE